MRGEAPDDEDAALLVDQLLSPLGAGRRLELVVPEDHLDLAAEDATLGVQLGLGELGPLLHVLGERRQGAAQRQGAADPDGVLALRPNDCREREGGCGGASTREECASIHVGLLADIVRSLGDGERQAIPWETAGPGFARATSEA